MLNVQHRASQYLIHSVTLVLTNFFTTILYTIKKNIKPTAFYKIVYSVVRKQKG